MRVDEPGKADAEDAERVRAMLVQEQMLAAMPRVRNAYRPILDEAKRDARQAIGGSSALRRAGN